MRNWKLGGLIALSVGTASASNLACYPNEEDLAIEGGAGSVDAGTTESGVVTSCPNRADISEVTNRLRCAFGYNAREYAEFNPDVAEFCDVGPNDSLSCIGGRGSGCDRQQCLARHWAVAGRFEGRRSANRFDVRAYLGRYPDLQQAYGSTNWPAAANHYVSTGSFFCLLGPCEARDGRP